MTKSDLLYEHCQMFLDRIQPWQGRNARLWRYTTSLQQLHLCLGLDSPQTPFSDVIVLSCVGCRHICAPPEWPSCQIEITPNLESIGSRTGATFTIADRGADVRITYSMLFVLTGEQYFQENGLV